MDSESQEKSSAVAPTSEPESSEFGQCAPPPSIVITTPQNDFIDWRPSDAKRTLESLKSTVQLSMSAKNLLDRDTFSKSDPVCVLYMLECKGKQWVEVARTERIKNDLNPVWATNFVLEYRFEERQALKFDIFDWDGKSAALLQHDFLGSIDCTLGEIVAAPEKKFVRNMSLPRGTMIQPKVPSELTVVAQELTDNKEVLELEVSGKRLDRKDLFGKSDPYIVISKLLDDGTWAIIHKTEVIKNTLNPDWVKFSLRVDTITSGGNLERTLRWEVLDLDFNGSSDIIGEFETNYCELTERYKQGKASFELVNHANKKKCCGIINIDKLTLKEDLTFVDYIQNGLQLNFTVAIDFTASNGDAKDVSSLHYTSNQNQPMDNQYTLAIKAVGEIIQDYDYDKMFPALGFGARIPPNNAKSFRFPLNGRPNPGCQGIEGILEAYHRTIRTVRFSGPTNFEPIVSHMKAIAEENQDGKNYFVLLIITDGVISDMEATKHKIIESSSLPMSIIIIGVGREDFTAMKELDSDGRLLKHKGQKASRDIVQFVEMRNFLKKPTMHSHPAKPRLHSGSKAGLARAVLAELPGQVVYWMKNFGPESST